MTHSDTSSPATGPDLSAAPRSHLRTGAVSGRKVFFFALSGLALPSVMSGEGGKMSLLSGWSSWLAMLTGSCMALLIAVIIVRFARRHLTTGSLMSYVRLEMGPRSGALTGAALLVGYVAALVLTVAIALVFLFSFLRSIGVGGEGPVLQALAGTLLLAIGTVLTWRGISLSVNAAVALSWSSLPFVLVIMVCAIARNGVDLGPQLALEGFSAGAFAQAVILAFGIYAGFEGVTALAMETSEPRRTIPRLLVTTVLTLGVVSTTGVGLTIPIMMGHSDDLLAGSSPLYILSEVGHVTALGSVLDALMFVTLLSVVVVYLSEAGRVVATAAEDGILPRGLAHVDGKHRTPARAVLALALLAGGILVAFLLVGGRPIFTIFLSAAVMVSYSWFTAYILIALAGVSHAVRRRDKVFGGLALLSATSTAGTAVFSLVKHDAGSTMPQMPWIALGSIALLWAAALVNQRRRPAPEPVPAT
ncbi:APC family permease [Streptomyces sp. NPDC048430]|uniref:APC family permease n=1 Tax=Streptomyces sp. NPDC048430 TaxID=3155388 RepID=UPI003415E08F